MCFLLSLCGIVCRPNGQTHQNNTWNKIYNIIKYGKKIRAWIFCTINSKSTVQSVYSCVLTGTIVGFPHMPYLQSFSEPHGTLLRLAVAVTLSIMTWSLWHFSPRFSFSEISFIPISWPAEGMLIISLNTQNQDMRNDRVDHRIWLASEVRSWHLELCHFQPPCIWAKSRKKYDPMFVFC